MELKELIRNNKELIIDGLKVLVAALILGPGGFAYYVNTRSLF